MSARSICRHRAMMLQTYSSIGPFDESSLPKGLLREHRLKPGSWGKLTLRSGAIRFVWDDDGTAQMLSAGDIFVVPPERPHHLELDGAFELTIDFQREQQ